MAGKMDTTEKMQELADKAIVVVCNAVPRAGFKAMPVRFEWANGRRPNAVGFSGNPKVGVPFIAINEQAWKTLSEEDKIQVLIHEACHVVIDRYIQGSRESKDYHGPAWRALMKACGLDPRVTFVEGAAEAAKARRRK